MPVNLPTPIKSLGERVSGGFHRWLSLDQIRSVVFCGGLLAIEELLHRMVITAAHLKGIKAAAYKHIHRLLFSGIYYAGVSKLGYKTEAIISSTTPLILSFVDGLSTIMGATPEELGTAAGEKLSMWLGTAKLSLGGSATKVSKFRSVSQEKSSEAKLPEGVTISPSQQRM